MMIAEPRTRCADQARFEHDLNQQLDTIHRLLLEKNRKYGDSALTPLRAFSKACPIEQINVRIDDKLSRIMAGQADEDEDVELDLIGYLLIKRIAKTRLRTTGLSAQCDEEV